MLKDHEYAAFKERSKRHSSSTLKAFEFWGRRVGRIEGQIKSKWGETRWYAKIEAPSSLHDLVYVGDFEMKYRWDPTKGSKYRALDTINNISKFFSYLLYVFIFYKLFFYNVAYWVAIFKNRDCASDIIWSASYPKKILLGDKVAEIVRRRNSRLLSKD